MSRKSREQRPALLSHVGAIRIHLTGTLRGYNRIDRLPEIRVSTLFVVGEYDEARPETMQEYQALVRGSIIKVVPDAGHLVHLDQTRAFNDMISEFLASVETR